MSEAVIDYTELAKAVVDEMRKGGMVSPERPTATVAAIPGDWREHSVEPEAIPDRTVRVREDQALLRYALYRLSEDFAVLTEDEGAASADKALLVHGVRQGLKMFLGDVDLVDDGDGK